MMCDDRAEDLNAFLDGELSLDAVAALTAHLATCPGCARHLAELGHLRAAMADAVPEEAPSPALSARVIAALDAAQVAPRAEILDVGHRFRRAARRKILMPFLSGAAATIIAATIIVALIPRHGKLLDLAAVRDAALRGTLAEVTPTSSGPYASVPGYRLIGTRADVIAGHASRVLIFTRGAAILTLCIWKANGEAAHGVKEDIFRGMRIHYWNNGSDEFWAASTGPAEGLRSFVRELG
jgi:anti-sigma factor RsiW